LAYSAFASVKVVSAAKESLDKWGLSGGTKQNEWFWPQIASEAIF
jgi:hypothetical protein